MVISYAAGTLIIFLANSGIMTARICEYLHALVDQSTAPPIRQPQTKVTSLSLSDPDGEITISTPTKQESLLSRLFRIKFGPDPKQENPQICTL